MLAGCAALLPAEVQPVRCAAGAALRTRGWPDGGGEWCESASGARNGPVRLTLRGFRVEGAYRDDQPAGRFRAWWPSGRRAGELDFDHGVPHGPLLAWYENGATLASGAFAVGRVSTPVVFFDARARARYRLDPEAAGVMDGHAFDERGTEITPEGDWLPAALPQAYELLVVVLTLTGLARR